MQSLFWNLKGIPLHQRGKAMDIIKKVSARLADKIFDTLPPEKLAEFNTINKNNKPALAKFVIDNFPNLEVLLMEETKEYINESYSLN